MNIRPEKESDIPAIRNVQVEAFKVHAISQQTEHFIVEHLRKDGALAVSLVAETEDGIVGHIAFSKVMIDGADLDWFILGPIGVLPEKQRKGIGSDLVRKGLAMLREMGAGGCLLVGEPKFYGRFGFTQVPGLVLPGIPPEYFMALPFRLPAPSGSVSHHAAFLATEGC